MNPWLSELIVSEQARHSRDQFIGLDIDSFMAKLAVRAEIVAIFAEARCRGFVAFYCNDLQSRAAYITLLIVDPRDRRTGIGSALVASALNVARHKGFCVCRLEVRMQNHAAVGMYRALGFVEVGCSGATHLMEVSL